MAGIKTAISADRVVEYILAGMQEELHQRILLAVREATEDIILESAKRIADSLVSRIDSYEHVMDRTLNVSLFIDKKEIV